MTELAVWMKEGQGWKYVPQETALYDFVSECAGCDGRVFKNARLSELVLCDGGDHVLWKMGNVREAGAKIMKQRKASVDLALSVAKMAVAISIKEMQALREDCAKIADKERELWEQDDGGGAAAAANIAHNIRKRSIETPERGGDVVDDAGPGGDRPSQPPLDLETHRVPANVCLSCGQKLDSATRIEGEADAPEPGNVTLCLHCGHMMVFADDMSLRELNDEEAYDLAGDPTILEFQRVRGMVMEKASKEAPPWPAKPPDDSEPPSQTPPKND